MVTSLAVVILDLWRWCRTMSSSAASASESAGTNCSAAGGSLQLTQRTRLRSPLNSVHMTAPTRPHGCWRLARARHRRPRRCRAPTGLQDRYCSVNGRLYKGLIRLFESDPRLPPCLLRVGPCLLYTSDAADEEDSVDL